MIKRTIAICLASIVMLTVCLSAAGCKYGLTPRNPYIYYEDYPALYSVLVCSVPGMGNNSSIVGKLEVLETDAYGRVLFMHCQINGYYTKEWVCAYVVCQQYDENGAYYFRDIDFALTPENTSIDESRINDLKARNGWDKPLDLKAEGICYTDVFRTFRFGRVTDFDNGYYLECGSKREKQLEENLLAKYSPEDFGDRKLWAHCFDIYDDGKAMYIVKVDVDSKNTQSDNGYKTCLIATYKDGKIYEGSPVWIDDPFSEEYYQQLVQFRAGFEEAAKNRGK